VNNLSLTILPHSTENSTEFLQRTEMDTHYTRFRPSAALLSLWTSYGHIGQLA